MCCLLVIVANQNWHVRQLDINNFLFIYLFSFYFYGDLDEEVYMQLPLGFRKSKTKNMVCKLKKSPLWPQASFTIILT